MWKTAVGLCVDWSWCQGVSNEKTRRFGGINYEVRVDLIVIQLLMSFVFVPFA